MVKNICFLFMLRQNPKIIFFISERGDLG